MMTDTFRIRSSLDFIMTTYGNALSECLDENPLNYMHIYELQNQDNNLLALQVKYPDNYVYMALDDDVDDIICYNKHPTKDDLEKCLTRIKVS